MQQMEQPIGGVVKCLSNQIRRHLDAAASEAGLVELTGTQGMILHYLLRNEGRCLTQRDVGAALSSCAVQRSAACSSAWRLQACLSAAQSPAISAAGSCFQPKKHAPCMHSLLPVWMKRTACFCRESGRRTRLFSAACACRC